MSDDLPVPYDEIGGEEAVRALVDRFYELMDTLPEAEGIRALHAKSLKVSREKLFMFLSGWLGGPNLFIEQYGHPRLRMRHMPFPIGVSERDQWLLCMQRAVDEQIADEAMRSFLMNAFARIADHMRNQPG